MTDDDRAFKGSALVGGFALLMGVLIIGSLVGLIPTEEGAYFAPRAILWSLGIGFVLGALLLLTIDLAPTWLRSLLFLSALALVAVVCNWSAFAPDVRYVTSTSMGPLSFSGEDSTGGRIVFGAAALLVDAVLLFGIFSWLRDLWKAT